MLLDQVAVAALGLRLLAARLRRRLEIALLAIGGERHQPALRRGAAAAFFCFPRPAFLAAFFGVFLPPPALPPSALRRSASIRLTPFSSFGRVGALVSRPSLFARTRSAERRGGKGFFSTGKFRSSLSH